MAALTLEVADAGFKEDTDVDDDDDEVELDEELDDDELAGGGPPPPEGRLFADPPALTFAVLEELVLLVGVAGAGGVVELMGEVLIDLLL